MFIEGKLKNNYKVGGYHAPYLVMEIRRKHYG
jgi:hypothetical protein